MINCGSGSEEVYYPKFKVVSGTLSSTIDGGHTSSITFQNTYTDQVVVAYLWERGGGQSLQIRVNDTVSTSSVHYEGHNLGGVQVTFDQC